MDDGLLKGVIYQHALVYARQLWRYKWLSIGVAWLVCVIGWPVVSLIPPKYESSARVYISADQYLTPLLKGLATDVDPHRQVEYLQRTLLSRPNLRAGDPSEQPRSLAARQTQRRGPRADAAGTGEGHHADLARAEFGEDHLPEFKSDDRQGCRAVAADRLCGNDDRQQSPRHGKCKAVPRSADRDIRDAVACRRAAPGRLSREVSAAVARDRRRRLQPGEGPGQFDEIEARGRGCAREADAVKAELDTTPKFLQRRQQRAAGHHRQRQAGRGARAAGRGAEAGCRI